jgi:hypothetical protein
MGVKKYNNYVLNLEDEYGLYGIGYCFNTGHEFYFDMDDYDRIKNYCWSEKKDKNYSRVRAYDSNTKKTIFMHYITSDRYCDHIDRNPFNNRKYNLRKATMSENNRNHNLRKNNKCGITGVHWHKLRSKWMVYIEVDSKRKHLGYFLEKDDAIKTRLEAEAKYFKEFAPQRHLFEEYGIKDSF